jgi:hypothetical protein
MSTCDDAFFDDHFYREPTVLRGYYRASVSAGKGIAKWEPPKIGKSMARDVDPGKIQLWVDAMVDVLTHGVKPRFRAEPPIGSVLRWTKTYDRKTLDPKTYEYVALRSDAGWHVTGRENATLPFEVLLDRIGDNPCSMVAEYIAIPFREPNPLDSITDPREWVRAAFSDPAAIQAAADQKAKTVEGDS